MSTSLTPQQQERASALSAEALIIDAMGGYIVAPEPPPYKGRNYLDRVADSNVRVTNITIAAHADDFEHALEKMFHYFNLLQVAGDRVMLIKTVADIERAHREKKIGIMFGFQSPTPIDIHIIRWTIFRQLGLRTCSLAYNEPNVFAHGCHDPRNGGLSYYGLQAINEMNRLGIVVDLSHVGEQSSLEAIEHSKKPCIFSHSNAKAVANTRRNITDEQAKLIASKGGVIGLSPHAFLSAKQSAAQPNLEDYLDHFDYLAKLVGIDHLGIGSDVFESYTKFSWETSTKLLYNSPWTYETVQNADYNKVEGIHLVIAGLVARGFSDADITKILGGNMLRVFGQVWRDDF
jgi:membrane dipeptidase